MTTLEVGKRLVELCQQGKNEQAIAELYARDIVSVEAAAFPDMPAEQRGLDAVVAKNQWWSDTHTIHSASATGPYPNGDRFAVRFAYDITNKPSGQRIQMDEIGIFTVADGKIAREEFFYLA